MSTHDQMRLQAFATNSGASTPYLTEIIYRPSDPICVRILVHDHTVDGLIRVWHVARHVLADALHRGQAGIGDVRLFVDRRTDRLELWLICPDRTRMPLQVSAALLDEFLGGTYHVTPTTAETQLVESALDQTLADLTSGAAS